MTSEILDAQTPEWRTQWTRLDARYRKLRDAYLLAPSDQTWTSANRALKRLTDHNETAR